MTGNRREFKVQVLPIRVQDNIDAELLLLEHCLEGQAVRFAGPVRLTDSYAVRCLVRLSDHLVQTEALVLMLHVSQ